MQEIQPHQWRTGAIAEVTMRPLSARRRWAKALHRHRSELTSQYIIRGCISGTVMRHFLTFYPVVALPLSMPEPAGSAALVTPTGGPQRLTARWLGTLLPTVHIAAVAMTADPYLRTTTGAQEKSGTVLHRLFLPMSVDLKGPDR